MLLMSSFSVVDAKGEKFRDQSNEKYIKHQTPPFLILIFQVVLIFQVSLVQKMK
jgi:hypothetical protein